MSNEEIEDLKEKFDMGISMKFYEGEMDGRVLYFQDDSVFLCVGSEEIEVNLLDLKIENFEEL